MTDYTKNTGSSGTMMIRDVGDGWVEFWLKAGSSTFNHDLPWAWVANGQSSGWLQYDFGSGGAWQKIFWVYISTSQNVTFKIGNSGTAGLGGPTDFTQWIDRATVPDAPSLAGPYSVTSNSARVVITDNSNGGASITDHQIGYGTDPNSPQFLSATSGTNKDITIGGLSSGVTYYFWARAWNTKGWSYFGNRVATTTLRVPDAPTTPVVTENLPTTLTITYSPNGDGGSPITGYDVGWGTNPDAPISTMNDGGSPATITGLTPGTVYHIWVRAKNAIGAGPWSGKATIRTIAGAYIRVGTDYKIAIPYVNVGGTWKQAQPFLRSGGVWKQTI